MSGFLTVLSTGPLALVEDLGRSGLASLGVGRSGAFDRTAHRLANRLVGNPEDAAALELLLGGARFTVDGPGWIAVTGAWGPVTANGRPVEPHTATPVQAGDVLEFGSAASGLRYTLAVRGGIAVEQVLGSRSRDTLAALGPAPLVPGDRLPIGPNPRHAVPAVDVVPIEPPPGGDVVLSVSPGPRHDWFESEAIGLLHRSRWIVSSRSDRTGVRLEGPALARSRTGELPSEGMVPGAIQVSPDGAPTILAVDAPVTGGYPVIAVVLPRSVDRLAQVRPGQGILLRASALRH